MFLFLPIFLSLLSLVVLYSFFPLLSFSHSLYFPSCKFCIVLCSIFYHSFFFSPLTPLLFSLSLPPIILTISLCSLYRLFLMTLTLFTNLLHLSFFQMIFLLISLSLPLSLYINFLSSDNSANLSFALIFASLWEASSVVSWLLLRLVVFAVASRNRFVSCF